MWSYIMENSQKVLATTLLDRSTDLTTRYCAFQVTKDHLAHKPRAVTMKLWQQKWKCPKAIWRQIQNHRARSRTLKCSVTSYGTRPSTKCYFNKLLFMRASSHMIKWNKPTVVSVRSVMVSRFCVRPTSKSWFLKASKRPRDTIHSMPCKNPCRLYIHRAFTYSVGPSSIVWRKLGPAPPFPPMRLLGVQWSRSLSLVCEVALTHQLSKTFKRDNLLTIRYWFTRYH